MRFLKIEQELNKSNAFDLVVRKGRDVFCVAVEQGLLGVTTMVHIAGVQRGGRAAACRRGVLFRVRQETKRRKNRC